MDGICGTMAFVLAAYSQTGCSCAAACATGVSIEMTLPVAEVSGEPDKLPPFGVLSIDVCLNEICFGPRVIDEIRIDVVELEEPLRSSISTFRRRGNEFVTFTVEIEGNRREFRAGDTVRVTMHDSESGTTAYEFLAEPDYAVGKVCGTKCKFAGLDRTDNQLSGALPSG